MGHPSSSDMPRPGDLGLTPTERSIATVLAEFDGPIDEALSALSIQDPDGVVARQHRVGPALYLRALKRGVELLPLSAWQRQLHAAAAHHLRMRATVEGIGACLARRDIEWLPLKGYDMVTRFYDVPEERLTSDVDLLIRPEQLAMARELLQEDGWQTFYNGPRYEEFLADEGYVWHASKPGCTFLELHFRLWGLVPDAFSEALFRRSFPDPSLPPGGRRLKPCDAYLVAAVHQWLTPAPRPLGSWWDLARITKSWTPEDVDELIRQARHWDLQLPVVLSAEVSATLWNQRESRSIADRLSVDLRPIERWLATRARRRGLVQLPLSSLQGARLLSGRRSRQGFKAAWRRLWAHPGVVERSTPDEWPWIRRRLAYQLSWLRNAKS